MDCRTEAESLEQPLRLGVNVELREEQNMHIGLTRIGPSEPTYIIAEIGINHNGSVATAKRLIDVASDSRCQAVKFQKRSPELSTPEHMKKTLRDTPWGQITYLEYKKRIEFDIDEYSTLKSYAGEKGLDFFASAWDEPSLIFMEELGVSAHKIASACLTDESLLKAHRATGKALLLSTGMSSMQEIERSVSLLDPDNLVLLHSTSSYPLDHEEANLRVIHTLQERFGLPVGYSGHETGLQISLAAVAMGAKVLERHITLNRSMWGSDHSASLEPTGLAKLVRDVRVIESALGDGIKKVYPSELENMKRLRKHPSQERE